MSGQFSKSAIESKTVWAANGLSALLVEEIAREGFSWQWLAKVALTLAVYFGRAVSDKTIHGLF